jgi:hypothetical protein
MIEPVKNVIRQEGDTYLVLPEGDFNNVFPKETHPTLFTKHITYLGFLCDSVPPTFYQVMGWNSTSYDEPITIRRLSELGAKRIHGWFDLMLKSFVEKANKHMAESVTKFALHLDEAAMCEAEQDIEAARNSLEITVGLGFPYEYIRLPEGLYHRLDTCPDDMVAELTPKRYQLAVNHYLRRAREQCNRGWFSSVTKLCDNAKYCAEKGFDESELNAVIKTIEEVRRSAFQQFISIERDREIASRFDWRRPNTWESWLVAELGHDPFPIPTVKDYAEIYAARQRLQN